MNALPRFSFSISVLLCLGIFLPTSAMAEGDAGEPPPPPTVSASPFAEIRISSTRTESVTIEDRGECDPDEVDCECPNGFVVSGTATRKRYQISASARPGCYFENYTSSQSSIDTWIDPSISSLQSCERENVSSMSCGPSWIDQSLLGQCIYLNYSWYCDAHGAGGNDFVEGSARTLVKIPPNIDGVQIYMDPPCLEDSSPTCTLEHLDDIMHQGYQNGLTVGKTMSLHVYVYTTFAKGDDIEASVTGAGVSKYFSGVMDEVPDGQRIVIEFEDVRPTRAGTVSVNFSLTRENDCTVTAESIEIPVKSDYCTYPISESDLENECNLKYYFYDPGVGCKDIDDVEVDAGVDFDANVGDIDVGNFDYDAGVLEDFDAGLDWDAGVIEDEDPSLYFDAGVLVDGSVPGHEGDPDQPSLDAGQILGADGGDGGSFPSGNDDPGSGAGSSSDDGGSASPDGGSGSAATSDAGFSGGIGLPEGSTDADGGSSSGSDDGPDSEFTGGDAGFFGGTSGGSVGGDAGGAGASGSADGGAGAGGESGSTDGGGSGFTGGTGFPGGSGFDGYDWGDGDSQGNTTPTAPDAGAGSGGGGSGSGDDADGGSGSGGSGVVGADGGAGSGGGGSDSGDDADGGSGGVGVDGGAGSGGGGSGSGDDADGGSGSGGSGGVGADGGAGSGGGGSGSGDDADGGSGSGGSGVVGADGGAGSGGGGSGSGTGSGEPSQQPGDSDFSLAGGTQKEKTVTGCSGCSTTSTSFLFGWIGLALLPGLRRRGRQRG